MMIVPMIWLRMAILLGWVSSVVSNDSSSHVQIPLPHELFKVGGYHHMSADFGSHPYGGSITEPLVYYPNPIDFCTQNTKQPDWIQKAHPKPTGTFLLVLEYNATLTDCTIIHQVRKAQHVGAVGVVFTNPHCLCSDQNCTAQSDEAKNNCQLSLPTFSATETDDTDKEITIPTLFLTNKVDGDVIIQNHLLKDTIVPMQLSWDLPNPKDRIAFELWTTPIPGKQEEEFQEHLWDTILKPFTKRITFQPHSYLYDGTKIGCYNNNNNDETTVCSTMCTNNGRYCFLLDDNDTAESAVTGKDVVLESLRRLCIWNHYTKFDTTKDDDDVESTRTYWDYVKTFSKQCHTDAKYKDAKCYEKVMKEHKIDPKVISQCMKDTGDTELNVENRFLADAMEVQSNKGIVVTPTLLMNGMPMRSSSAGVLSLNHLVTTICTEFSEREEQQGDDTKVTKELHVCQVCSESACSPIVSKRLECIRAGVCSSSTSSSKSISKRFFGLTLLALFTIGVIAAALYYRKNRDDMRNKVLHILAEYMPLDNAGGADGAGDGTNIGSGATGIRRIGEMFSRGGGNDGGESGTAALLSDTLLSDTTNL